MRRPLVPVGSQRHAPQLSEWQASQPAPVIEGHPNTFADQHVASAIFTDDIAEAVAHVQPYMTAPITTHGR
jgi:hypothetical protein